MNTQLKKNKFAYAFYATDNHYALAVCVAIRLLKKTKVRNDIDFIVAHLKISKTILKSMHQMNVNTKRVEKLPYSHKHFEDCFTKFYIFQFLQYDRIIYFDSDTYVLQNLDHLFTLPLKGNLAAPRAYWLPQPCVTSLLLVVKPSMELWNRAQKHFATAREKYLFDMEVINLEFKDELHYLPDEYACLNTEWEDRDKPYHFGDPKNSINTIKLVHFTAVGKPWRYQPKLLQKMRPRMDMLFLDIWDKWWQARDAFIKENPLAARTYYTFLKYIVQLEKLKWLRAMKTKFDRLVQKNDASED